MTNGNDLIHEGNYRIDEQTVGQYPNHGLTKREYFAAMAMQGMISNITITEHTKGQDSRATNEYFISGLSIYAVKHADALIKALNETK